MLQHIFAETEKKILHSWSFACWRSQKEDQRDASSSFPGLPLVQGQGDGEEHKCRKVSYWKVEKYQELKTGQQVFTFPVNTCVFRLFVEEFLCSSSDLICSKCASGNRSAAHSVTDCSEKMYGWQDYALVSICVGGCCKASPRCRSWRPGVFFL